MSYIWNRIVEIFELLFVNVYIPKINLYDIFEISIIIILFYFLAKTLKNTRSWVLVKGSMFLIVCYLLAYLMSFNVITKIFESIIIILAIGFVVIFSPEIKKFLENIGTKKIKNEILTLMARNTNEQLRMKTETIEEICAACEQMSKDRTGALIVCEDDVPLNEYVETGIKMDSAISRQLLLNIFEHNTPLHDGAIIIKNDTIKSATCYLPLSEDKKISKHHGTRHRAAIGISEVTDAFTIVVSEETGRISITRNGKIQSVNVETLKEKLTEFQAQTVIIKKKKFTDILKNNLTLKLVSLLFGIILWIVVINTSNPIITSTIHDVPIKILNSNAITDLDKIYDIQGDLSADIKITGHRSEIEEITPEDIQVVADLSKLSEINTVRLSASISGHDVSFKLVDEIVKIEIENCIEKELDITIEKHGTEDPSVYVYEIFSESKKIKVKGPESIIKKIEKAQYKINIEGCDKDTEYFATPTLYDKNGKVIEHDNLELSETEIKFTAKTLKTKEVSLSVSPNCSHYFRQFINTFSAVPSFVTIAASDEQLNKMDTLSLSIPIQLNYEDILKQSYTSQIDISTIVPEGIYVPPSSRKVDIVIGFASDMVQEIKFSSNDIEIRNLDAENFSIDIPAQEFVISAFGDKEAIMAIDINTLKPFVDLSNIQEGENVIYIEYDNAQNIKIASGNKISIIATRLIVESPPEETEPSIETTVPSETTHTTLPSDPTEAE